MAMLQLGYQNEGFTDGLGAQAQRLFSIYCVSKLLNCPYYHSGIKRIDYHGLVALESGEDVPELVSNVNALFALTEIGKHPNQQPDRAYFTQNPTLEQIVELKCHSLQSGSNTLLLCHTPYAIADRYPSLYKFAKSQFNYETALKYARKHCTAEQEDEVFLPKNGVLRVAVHVRRGEIMANAPSRLLTDEYYLNIISQVSTILRELGIRFNVEIHSELPKDNFTVNLQKLGVQNDGTFEFTDNYLSAFSCIPNSRIVLNQHPIISLLNLSTADILIGSRSSFSYTAAIAGRSRAVIMPRFWHSLLPNWIEADSRSGDFDSTLAIDRITSD